MNVNGFIEKTEWPSSSPDLNPLDYHIWGTMLEKYHKLQPRHKTTDELKVALQTIWEENATRTCQQGGGNLHQLPDCLCGCGCHADISAVSANFCMKFYATVKQSNIHFITKFG